jgi:hypothetical protein
MSHDRSNKKSHIPLSIYTLQSASIGHFRNGRPYYVTSNTIGTSIRNAVTGTVHHNFRVGQRYERLFFKVHLTTSTLVVPDADQNKRAVANSREINKGEPDLLFYDSPDEFEQHSGYTVDAGVAAAWRETYMGILAELTRSSRRADSGAGADADADAAVESDAAECPPGLDAVVVH